MIFLITIISLSIMAAPCVVNYRQLLLNYLKDSNYEISEWTENFITNLMHIIKEILTNKSWNKTLSKQPDWASIMFGKIFPIFLKLNTECIISNNKFAPLWQMLRTCFIKIIEKIDIPNTHFHISGTGINFIFSVKYDNIFGGKMFTIDLFEIYLNSCINNIDMKKLFYEKFSTNETHNIQIYDKLFLNCCVESLKRCLIIQLFRNKYFVNNSPLFHLFMQMKVCLINKINSITDIRGKFAEVANFWRKIKENLCDVQKFDLQNPLVYVFKKYDIHHDNITHLSNDLRECFMMFHDKAIIRLFSSYFDDKMKIF